MIEAVVMGRVGIDLYPDQIETPLSQVRSFTRFVGGFAGNVSTGLSRLGVRTAIVSRIGAEGHGDFVRDWLAGQGVDVRFLATDPDWQTPPTFCEVWPPDNFPLTFYRSRARISTPRRSRARSSSTRPGRVWRSRRAGRRRWLLSVPTEARPSSTSTGGRSSGTIRPSTRRLRRRPSPRPTS